MSSNSNFSANDDLEFVQSPISPTIKRSLRMLYIIFGISVMLSKSDYNSAVGEIQHDHQLTEQIGQLLYNDCCSDVTLIVEGAPISAHKVILSARSTYFWAMFYGGMRESTADEVTLKDTPAHAFRVLLKYIYSGRIQLSSMNFDLILDVLGLTHKYGFQELETAIADYLKAVLNCQNVYSIYSTAFFYSIDTLVVTCFDYFDGHATETLESAGLESLDILPLVRLIERNSFSAPELDIFRAVCRWTDAHPEESERFPLVLAKIRLALIKLKDLLDVVRPTGLISADQLLDAINEQIQHKNCELIYRGLLIPNVNVATSRMGAKVIVGHGRFDSQTGALSEIDTTSSEQVVIELGRCCIINHIQLNFSDLNELSYFVEVSVDREDWICVADHLAYVCRSRQRLFFRERVAKYIRVARSGNTGFYVRSLAVMYSTEPFDLDPDTKLLIPHENVATIPRHAIVIEGVSRSRNALLNGETENYDWDNGYTCHELGSGSIIVELPQPYLIDSMRLLLWDCDNRTYSFYVEVSGDFSNWTRVATITQARSWQTLQFQRTPVVFVKIVGTHNSANDVFHCVHFECPATTTSSVPAAIEPASEAESHSTKPTKPAADVVEKQFENNLNDTPEFVDNNFVDTVKNDDEAVLPLVGPLASESVGQSDLPSPDDVEQSEK